MKPINQKHKTNEKIERNPTEPVVEGLRSDCCGAMTEQIFLEILLLHLGIENCDDVENAVNPKSFCKKKEFQKWVLLKFDKMGKWELGKCTDLVGDERCGIWSNGRGSHAVHCCEKSSVFFFSKENITY